jgi:hypothetical protein
MTNRFMISVAALALIAGTGFANAQGTGTSREGSSGGSTMQQSAPSSAGSSAGQMSHESTESKSPDTTKSPSGMKSTQTEQKSPSAAKNNRAEDMQKSKSMSSENDSAKGGAKDMKAEDRNGNMKAEGREDRSGNMKAEGREDRSGNMNAETKGTERSQTTTGQAGAGAKLSTEQRTKITTVIRQQNVAPVTHVDFDIRPGVRVTRGVKFYPLPSEVVSVYPEWRGYEYILVKDQIVVVDPRTLEIVDVINV